MKDKRMILKRASVVMIFCAIIMTMFGFGVEANAMVIGDVDGNGSVNALDRQVLARHLARWDGYEEGRIQKVAADVNNDGAVNSLDRQILARHVAGWPGYEQLPYGVVITTQTTRVTSTTVTTTVPTTTTTAAPTTTTTVNLDNEGWTPPVRP